MVEDTHKDDYDEDSLVLCGTRAYSLADLAFPSAEKNTEIMDKMGFMLLFKHEQMKNDMFQYKGKSSQMLLWVNPALILFMLFF